MEQNVKYVLKV